MKEGAQISGERGGQNRQIFNAESLLAKGKTLFVFGGGTSEENFTERDGIGECHS